MKEERDGKKSSVSGRKYGRVRRWRVGGVREAEGAHA